MKNTKKVWMQAVVLGSVALCCSLAAPAQDTAAQDKTFVMSPPKAAWQRSP